MTKDILDEFSRKCPECFAPINWDATLEAWYCPTCGWVDFGDGDTGVFAFINV